jgi:spermidine dehydrogenase
MWSTVAVAHDLRDGKFSTDAARRRAVDTGERYDLIVVGGGFSGLGAAAFHQKLKGGRVLVLDNHPMVGGEAKRNEFDVNGVRLIGPQGSNDFGTRPPGGWIGEYWKDLSLPAGPDAYEYQQWGAGVTPLEMARDNYYFQLWADEFASHGYFFREPNDTLHLVRNAFDTGFDETPWSPALREDFRRWRQSPKVYDGTDLARWLDTMTYEELLVKQLNLDPAVARYADPILAGAAGGLGSDVISAQCAAQIGLPGTSNGRAGARGASHKLADVLPFGSSFPGGNDGIMRHVLRKLVPDSIDGTGFAGTLNGRVRFETLDRRTNPTRIRLGATVVHVANLPNGSVEVLYVLGGKLH